MGDDMKIGFTGLDLPEGKIKYNDAILKKLEDKYDPKKTSPYFVEFVRDEYERVDAIAIAKENVLDLLILDIEKLEGRAERSSDPAEKRLMEKCLEALENERPVRDLTFDDDERTMIVGVAPLSLKPTVVFDEAPASVDALIEAVMDKADVGFFYTAGKPEVHAWFVNRNADIVTCAGKIHSDLARGFIKAEIVNAADLEQFHNLQDARSKGLSKLVDRDYLIQSGDIIDIRFNV